MKRSKKVFLILAVIFLIILLVISYDISTRTSWPGQTKDGQGRLKEEN